MSDLKLVAFVVIAALFLLGCQQDETNPRLDINDNLGAITLFANQSTSEFDLKNIDDLEVSFDLAVDEFEDPKVQWVKIQMIFTDADRIRRRSGVDLIYVDSVYAAVDVKIIRVLPSRVTVTIDELVEAIPDFSSTDQFFLGDSFDFIFSIMTNEGQELVTILESDLCQQPGQPSFGGCQLSVDIVCQFDFSEALGTYRWVQDGFPAALNFHESIMAVQGPELNTIKFLDLFGHEVWSPRPNSYDIVVQVDPFTSHASVSQQDAFDTGNLLGIGIGTNFGVATIEGDGTLYTCNGLMTLDLTTRVSAGSFGEDRYILQKE